MRRRSEHRREAAANLKRIKIPDPVKKKRKKEQKKKKERERKNQKMAGDHNSGILRRSIALSAETCFKIATLSAYTAPKMTVLRLVSAVRHTTGCRPA